VIIDPATDAVTHLVVQPGRREEDDRLVPVDLVESTADDIKLRCTRDEFDMLELAEQRDLGQLAPGGLAAYVSAL